MSWVAVTVFCLLLCHTVVTSTNDDDHQSYRTHSQANKRTNQAVHAPNTSVGAHSGVTMPTNVSNCSVMQQANCVSGTPHLANHGSYLTVKFLGVFKIPSECELACNHNSTPEDPCHSWAFYYPDTPSPEYAGSCYGRHDRIFAPVIDIPIHRNHVCTAISCEYPVPPTPPPPPSPPPPTPAPIPKRPPAAIDNDLAPVAYLGGVGDVGSENFSLVCNFQVVAVINSYCWQYHSPEHVNCTNNTQEARYIMDVSKRLKSQCPSVLTQMYINSMMNFWWYTDMFARFEGTNESQLLHDIHGNLVRVLQDGGNPNISVFDWGNAATRINYMQTVDAALESGITSFFLDKGSISAQGTQICNHVCGTITEEQGKAWNEGHWQILREIAMKSPGPTVGNGGPLEIMGGAHAGQFKADEKSIVNLQKMLALPYVSSVFAQFPVSTNGYAAFLMAYAPGRAWVWWYSSAPKWTSEFGFKLGKPLAPASKSEAGIYSRKFSGGYIVSFDTHTNEGSFTRT